MMIILSGCWDNNDPEDYALVLAAGYDFDPATEQYIVIFQISNPLLAKGAESNVTDHPPYWVVSGKGATPIDAVINIRKKIPRLLNYSHLGILVLSEEIITKEGVIGIIDTLARSRQSRPILNIAVAEGDVKKVLTANFPIETTNGQGLIKLLRNISNQLSGIITQNGREFLIKLSTPGIEASAPIISLQEKKDASDQKAEKPKPDDPPKIEIDSMATFYRDKMSGKLNKMETSGWSWITNQAMIPGINFIHPGNEKARIHVTVHNFSTQVKPVMKNNKPLIRIKTKVTGRIESITGTSNYKKQSIITKEMDQRLANKIEEEIAKSIKKAQSLKSDIFGFGNAFYRLKYKEWLKMEANWPEIFANLPVEIEVEGNIGRTGLINKGIIIK